jgi:1,4-alpha-glucan branching enzyme
VRDLVRELNRVQSAEPALHRCDTSHDGFSWLEADDRDNSVFAFARYGDESLGDRPVVCVANLTPVPRDRYRVGLPRGGRWVTVLDTDDKQFGGSGYGAGDRGGVDADDVEWHGQHHSVELDLAPLAVRWLVPS